MHGKKEKEKRNKGIKEMHGKKINLEINFLGTFADVYDLNREYWDEEAKKFFKGKIFLVELKQKI